MAVLTWGETSNQALIINLQLPGTSLDLPPNASNNTSTSTPKNSTFTKTYPDTSLNLNLILKNNQLECAKNPVEGRISKLILNSCTVYAIILEFKAQASVASTWSVGDTTISRSELDIHINIMVLGRDWFIFESTGGTCNVEYFAT